MGIELRRGDGSAYTTSQQAWQKLCLLALMGGWKPEGTHNRYQIFEGGVLIKDGETRNGSYFFNEGRSVSDNDAENIADALKQVLPDIPRHDARNHKTEESGNGLSGLDGGHLSPLEYYSGEMRKRVIEFIQFCREGCFQIQ